MLRRVGLLAVGCCCWASGMLMAADVDPAALQKSLVESAERFSKAFAERDAKAMAALFTPQAEYVDATGLVFHGREAIEAEFAASLEVEPPGTLSIEIISIRPVAEGIVVEDGVTTFQSEGEGPTASTRYTATHARQEDGTWLMASVRELESAEISPHDRLLALDWLVGAWRQESDGTVVDTEWKWSDDGNFLVSQFSSTQTTGESLNGVHRVGWDGERKQFRSWVFNSNGGSAEGWWTPGFEGEWSVALTGTDPAGARMSTRVTYDRDGSDALVITVDQRVLAGESLPTLSSRVVRQPPAPAKQAASR